jgi:hypothetical protein
VKCWCGIETTKRHYPAGDPENGPAHMPAHAEGESPPANVIPFPSSSFSHISDRVNGFLTQGGWDIVRLRPNAVILYGRNREMTESHYLVFFVGTWLDASETLQEVMR